MFVSDFQYVSRPWCLLHPETETGNGHLVRAAPLRSWAVEKLVTQAKPTHQLSGESYLIGGLDLRLGNLTTPQLTTPQLTTPQLTTPQLTTPQLTTPQLTTNFHTNFHPTVPLAFCLFSWFSAWVSAFSPTKSYKLCAGDLKTESCQEGGKACVFSGCALALGRGACQKQRIWEVLSHAKETLARAQAGREGLGAGAGGVFGLLNT